MRVIIFLPIAELLQVGVLDDLTAGELLNLHLLVLLALIPKIPRNDSCLD